MGSAREIVVPIPPARSGAPTSVYGIEAMEVGECRTFDGYELIGASVRSRAAKVARGHGRRFVTRRHGDQIRIWRTE